MSCVKICSIEKQQWLAEHFPVLCEALDNVVCPLQNQVREQWYQLAPLQLCSDQWFTSVYFTVFLTTEVYTWASKAAFFFFENQFQEKTRFFPPSSPSRSKSSLLSISSLLDPTIHAAKPWGAGHSHFCRAGRLSTYPAGSLINFLFM